MGSRLDRIYRQFADVPGGYELSPERSYFSIILPEATTNLVINPSVEAGTTGYAAYGGAMARILTWQAYGAAGLQITPAVSTASGFYFGTVTLGAGLTYTASIVIQGEEGKKYYIAFATTAGAILQSRVWIGTGHKQRIWLTYWEPTGASRRVYVYRDAQYADQNIFYADGMQVEEKPYPTTFCDGDQKGFVINQLDYWWNGTPGASTSSRSAQTRSGGREVNLLDFGIQVLAIVGLGMAQLVDQSLAIPGYGQMAQGTGTTAREFQLITAVTGEGRDGRHLQAQLATFEDAIKPDLVTVDQPLILRFQACDDEGREIGEMVDIQCKYRGGLEGNWDNHQQARVALNFRQYVPFIQSSYDSGIELGYQTAIANVNYILMRTAAGVWQEMSGGTDGQIYAIVAAPDGSVYVAGNYSLAGGVSNTAYIAKWNGTTWSPLDTGLNGVVYALVIGPDGTLYVGGTFLNAGGVAAADYIAKWNGTAWSALGSGTGGAVYALAFDNAGNLYAGGNFTNLTDANGDFISVWNGAAWSSLGSGLQNWCNDIIIDKAGNIYATGKFTSAIGVAGTAYIAKWNGAAWSALGTGLQNTGHALTFGLDGTLFVGGEFTNASGIAGTAYLAQWNGTAWQPVGTGVNNSVGALATDPNGNILVGGLFTTAGGITLPDPVAQWTRSIWTPIDVNFANGGNVQSIVFDKVGNLYLGANTFGTAYSATVTVPNVPSATSYPIVTFTGPGTTWQLKNYTTGKSIFFDNLTLLAGETAVLNLDPMHVSFVSSFRGNIMGSILPGSNLNFPLLPGNNNISTYMYGSTTAATAVTITWRGRYWSTEGTIWK